DLPSAAFDCVLLFEVVEHLKDEHLAGMLTEVARVLRPGGTLVVTTPNDEDLALATRFCPDCGAVYHEWQHIRTWSVSSLDRTVQPYGFQLQRYRTLDFTAKGSLRGRLRQLARLLEGRPAPHMVAVFGRK
ncbi:MAG: class I SAM-dependent methyltransferase, partial [Armatimonadota bacterium]